MKRVLVTAFLLTGWILGAPAMAREASAAKEIDPEVLRAFEIFAQVIELVKDNYLEPVQPEILVRGAVDGMILSVDRYGEYLGPGEPMVLPSRRAPAAAGIDLGIRDGHLTVIQVHPGGAAELAGLKPGDQIYLLGSRPGYRLTLREADDLLSGEPGETVKVALGRPSEQRTLELEILLAPLLPAAPPVLQDIGTGMLLLDVPGKVDARVARLLAEGITRAPAQGIILDLRKASRGEEIHGIQAAQNLASPDEPVAVAAGKEGEEERRWHGREGGDATRIIVLMSPSTAGPAEVLASAVRRAGKGTLLGARSFGKALLQETVPLEEGGTLLVTRAHFLDAQGEKITGRGLEPDALEPVVGTEDAGGTEDALLDQARSMLAPAPTEPS